MCPGDHQNNKSTPLQVCMRQHRETLGSRVVAVDGSLTRCSPCTLGPLLVFHQRSRVNHNDDDINLSILQYSPLCHVLGTRTS